MVLCNELDGESLPKKNTSKCNEQADNNGRGGRANRIIGFLQSETHDGAE